MEKKEANFDPGFLRIENENGALFVSILILCSLYVEAPPDMYITSTQMVPLVKRSADTLVELIGEKADSGESIDILK